MTVGPSVIHQYVLELLKDRMIIQPVGDQGTVWLGVEGFESVGIMDADIGAALQQLYDAAERVVLDRLDRGEVASLPAAGGIDFTDQEKQAIAAYHPRPPLETDPDQAWFWTEEWQAGEREADADLEAGRVRHFPDSESFLASLS